MKFRFIILAIITGLLVSCAEIPVAPSIPFQLAEREYLYKYDQWTFTGRLALAEEKESFSASIIWKHYEDFEKIELAGPFGQGRTLLTISKGRLVIDDGEKRLEYFGDINELISKYTGIKVPVLALKHWVLGLVEPVLAYQSISGGFIQSGWNVSYMQMQTVDKHELPRKLTIEKDKAKLKLIINQWYL